MNERKGFQYRRNHALITALLFVGLMSASIFAATANNATKTIAYAEPMMNSSNNMSMSNGTGNDMIMSHSMQGYHVVKGQISNVQLSSNGDPAWIQSGVWVLRVNLQNS